MTHDIEITSERITEGLISSILPLLNQHWAEVSPYPDRDLEPNYAWYLENSENGSYCLVLARADEDIAGYMGYLVGEHAHHTGLIVATQDLFYVNPLRRKGRLGMQLIQASERYLKARGVNIILQSVTPQCDFSALLQRSGYADMSKTMQKRI